MKLFFTTVLLFISLMVSAQWSNTTNLFYDSLHMPVSTALKTQTFSIVVQSYPDSGYFVIWEDSRNDPANSKYVIYAQKYDKAGNQLWAQNGVPISSSTNNQHYTFSSNADYRNRSFAATDSAGGFYIAYSNDSVKSYVFERACVQHMRSDGSAVFGGAGYIVASSTTANQNLAEKLIPDGNKGFFISYLKDPSSIYVYCYKDNNGTMQNYGGGLVNENAVQAYMNTSCGSVGFIQYPTITVLDYNIWYDGQKGCNIVMAMSGNGAQGKLLATNKVWRAKKNSTVTVYRRDNESNAQPQTSNYIKDQVYVLWYPETDFRDVKCKDFDGNIYVTTSYRLIQGGFIIIDAGATVNNLNFPKGTILNTTGNININIIGVSKQLNSTGANYFVQGYGRREEIYDSIPFQRASSTDPDIGYNDIVPPLNNLNNFSDTLLATGIYSFDFSLAGGSNQVYSSGLISEPALNNGNRTVRLQHLAAERITADSFALVYKTDVKAGVVIGKDLQNYFFTPQYDFPLLTVNNTGNALFYIKENNGNTGPVRVSPIFKGAELAWGAMGRAIGTGVYNGFYDMSNPFTALDPANGNGVISWTDTRNNSTSDNDIFMRHLDSLNLQNYYPPYKRIRLIPNVYTASTSNPATLFGSSKRYSLFETYAPYGADIGVTPVAEIIDNNYMGSVGVRVFQNTGSIRTYNSKPYLDRNFTIYSDSFPSGASTNLRLFFTTAEFNALKAANSSIANPGFLSVIRQLNGTSSYPSAYTPAAGDQTISPIGWLAVAGGYYVEIVTNPIGNFFINGSAPGLWTGTVSTDWNTAGNWSDNNVPVATSNVTIPTGVTNMPVLAGATTITNLTLQSATTLTLNNQTFSATGTISGSGTFTGSSTSSLILSGSNSVINFTQTSSSTRSLNNLILNSGSNAKLGSALNIFGIVNLTIAGLDLAANNLTLKSTATGTAMISNVTGSLLASATNVTIERYIPQKRAWRLMTAPLSNANTIYNSWQNGGVYAAGIGTHITGPGGSGLDAASSYSIKKYNASTQVLENVTNTTVSISNNTGSADNIGYFIFVRGDRNTNNLTAPNTNNTTLSANGTLQTGNQNFAITGGTNNYTLIGNPYPSPVDFGTLTKTLVTDRFYVWDPKLSGVGGYVLMQGPSYAPVPYGGSYTQNQLDARIIQSSQAFFVQPSSASQGTLGFKETDKIATNLNVFRTASSNEKLNIRLYQVDGNTTSITDGVLVNYNNAYSSLVDINDAPKLQNINENLAIERIGKLLTLEERQVVDNADTIPLKLWNTTQRSYQLELIAENLNHPNLNGYLIDNFLKTKTPLELNGTTNINFSITADAASSAANRFSIVFGKDVMTNINPAIVLYPNPVKNGNITLQFSNMPKGFYNIQLVNNLGQILLRKQINHAEGTSIETIAINKIKGFYTLEIIKPDNTKSLNKVIIN